MLVLVAKATWWNQHQGAITLLSLIFGLVAIAITVAFFMYERDKRTFDWQLLTDEPIMTHAPREGFGIKVIWNTTELQHPRLVTVRLMNTGKREIRESDFDGPTLIAVGEGFEVKKASAIRRRPGMRHTPVCWYNSDGATINPIAYNPGNWVDVQLLVDTADESLNPVVTVDSVVLGETRPGKRVEAGQSPMRNRLIGVFMASILLVPYAFLSHDPVYTLPVVTLAAAILVVIKEQLWPGT